MTNLSCNVSNWQLRQDNLGATLGDAVQLVVENVPLGVHDLLVLRDIV